LESPGGGSPEDDSEPCIREIKKLRIKIRYGRPFLGHLALDGLDFMALLPRVDNLLKAKLN